MAQKRITKRKLKRQKRFLIFIIIILSILDVTILIKYINKGTEEVAPAPEPEIIPMVEGYNPEKNYYQPIKSYKDFKALYNDNKISYIAVIDDISPVADKYKELINKYTYKENKKIYLLNLSELSKANLKAYYDIDVRFSLIESNYFILVKDSKIMSLTEFKDETIEDLIESLGIEE